jgi:alkylated DNA nucleotide flippase Atl1
MARRGDFAGAVLDLVHAIPPGRVMTYGDVAAALGSGAARAVGTVMSRQSGDAPWWRVIRAGGWPPVGLEERARPHYDAEGTPIVATPGGYRIDLGRARHLP